MTDHEPSPAKRLRLSVDDSPTSIPTSSTIIPVPLSIAKQWHKGIIQSISNSNSLIEINGKLSQLNSNLRTRVKQGESTDGLKAEIKKLNQQAAPLRQAGGTPVLLHQALTAFQTHLIAQDRPKSPGVNGHAAPSVKVEDVEKMIAGALQKQKSELELARREGEDRLLKTMLSMFDDARAGVIKKPSSQKEPFSAEIDQRVLALKQEIWAKLNKRDDYYENKMKEQEESLKKVQADWAKLYNALCQQLPAARKPSVDPRLRTPAASLTASEGLSNSSPSADQSTASGLQASLMQHISSSSGSSSGPPKQSLTPALIPTTAGEEYISVSDHEKSLASLKEEWRKKNKNINSEVATLKKRMLEMHTSVQILSNSYVDGIESSRSAATVAKNDMSTQINGDLVVEEMATKAELVALKEECTSFESRLANISENVNKPPDGDVIRQILSAELQGAVRKIEEVTNLLETMRNDLQKEAKESRSDLEIKLQAAVSACKDLLKPLSENVDKMREDTMASLETFESRLLNITGLQTSTDQSIDAVRMNLTDHSNSIQRLSSDLGQLDELSKSIFEWIQRPLNRTLSVPPAAPSLDQLRPSVKTETTDN